MKYYLTNARIVLADEIVEDGSVLIEDGTIAAINPESGNNTAAVNLEGKILKNRKLEKFSGSKTIKVIGKKKKVVKLTKRNRRK